jgi:hypothetical protein
MIVMAPIVVVVTFAAGLAGSVVHLLRYLRTAASASQKW